MATLSVFITFDSDICTPAIQRKGVVDFPWQQWLPERATMLVLVCVDINLFDENTPYRKC
jgi:hypothetical protein